MSDSLVKAVEDLKGKIGERVAALKADPNWQEVQRLYSGLGVLEELCDQPKTDLTTLLGISTSKTQIGEFEFAGLPPLEAAKSYLRKIKLIGQNATSLENIVSALKQGGLDVNKDELRISLSRSTYEILKAGEDIYGLLENFPHIKRGSGKKKAPQEFGKDATPLVNVVETGTDK